MQNTLIRTKWHRQARTGIGIDVADRNIDVRFCPKTVIAEIGTKYASGDMLTGEVKAVLIAQLTEIVMNHQAARAAVTDDIVREFMSVRPLEF